MYWDINNLYVWAMLPADGFKWKKNKSKFTQKFMQYYNDGYNERYIFEIDVIQLKKLHSNLRFLPEKMKIEKCQKLVCNLYDKKEYVIHTKSLKLV